MNNLHKVLLFSSSILLAFGGCCTFSGPVYKGPKSAHFDGQHFQNLQGKRMQVKVGQMIRFATNTKLRGAWSQWVSDKPGKRPPRRVGKGELRVTFINHASVLIQMDGVNILTDPVYGVRTSPVSFAGPIRRRAPGIRFQDLPPIDLVLVSHNHYDHMDLPTLRRVYRKYKPLILVPLGNRQLLWKHHIRNVVQMDWWESEPIQGGVRVTFVPAQHASGRGICDQRRTLWGGYVLSSRNSRPVYFSGYTGWGIHFARIHQRFGPMRLALLPIAPERPRRIMEAVHMGPKEAVRAHLTLQAQMSMAFHFGTFRLGWDGQNEPVRRLREERRRAKVAAREFLVPRHGVGYTIK